jgi:hypothetical protein
LAQEGLNGDLPSQERMDRADPRSLAQLATRTELRRPGTLERTFDGIDPRGSTVAAGGLLGGNLLQTVAAVVVGTAIADALFADGTNAEGYQDGAGTDQGTDGADAGYDIGGADIDTTGDFSLGDFAGGDFD